MIELSATSIVVSHLCEGFLIKIHIDQVYYFISYYCDESLCCLNFEHLPFQCACNDTEILASYAKGNYDFYDVEQIEEFVAWKGAYEIISLLENIDDAPHKSESFAILKYCMDNYNDNAYITEFLKGFSPPKEETNAMQELMEEEIAEIGSSLDEKEEENDQQKEEEWSNYPCLPSNDNNSLTHTLFDDGYDPKYSCETSLFDKNDLVIYNNPCHMMTHKCRGSIVVF